MNVYACAKNCGSSRTLRIVRASNDYSERFQYHSLVATHQVYAENPSSENLHCFAYRIHVNVFDRTKTDQFPARQARLLT